MLDPGPIRTSRNQHAGAQYRAIATVRIPPPPYNSDSAAVFENSTKIERSAARLELTKRTPRSSCPLCLSRNFSRKQYLMRHMGKYRNDKSPLYTCSAQIPIAKTAYDTWVSQAACRAVRRCEAGPTPYALSRSYFDEMTSRSGSHSAKNNVAQSFRKVLGSPGVMFVLRTDIEGRNFRRAGNVISTPWFANAIFREFVIYHSIKSARATLSRWIPFGDMLPSRSSCYENVLADLFAGKEVSALRTALRNRIYDLDDLTHIGVDGAFKMTPLWQTSRRGWRKRSTKNRRKI